MSATTLTETCSCGATFCVTTAYVSTASEAARVWREGHQHAETIGICGDRSPEIVGLGRMFCTLKAGHAGLHGDSDGNWTNDADRTSNREKR